MGGNRAKQTDNSNTRKNSIISGVFSVSTEAFRLIQKRFNVEITLAVYDVERSNDVRPSGNGFDNIQIILWSSGCKADVMKLRCHLLKVEERGFCLLRASNENENSTDASFI